MLMCQCANGAALCLRWRVLMPQGISTLVAGLRPAKFPFTSINRTLNILFNLLILFIRQ